MNNIFVNGEILKSTFWIQSTNKEYLWVHCKFMVSKQQFPKSKNKNSKLINWTWMICVFKFQWIKW